MLIKRGKLCHGVNFADLTKIDSDYELNHGDGVKIWIVLQGMLESTSENGRKT